MDSMDSMGGSMHTCTYIPFTGSVNVYSNVGLNRPVHGSVLGYRVVHRLVQSQERLLICLDFAQGCAQGSSTKYREALDWSMKALVDPLVQPLGGPITDDSYTKLTLPTNREV